MSALLKLRPLGFVHVAMQQPWRIPSGFGRRMCLMAHAEENNKYQRPLTGAERKAKRADAHKLGKSIVTCQIGQRGLTESFLQSSADALRANELIKVRLGDCDISRDEAAKFLEDALDCVAVHKIGSTILLYRDKRLPQLQYAELTDASATGENDSIPENGNRHSKKGKKIKDRGAVPENDKPPEFQVIE